MAKEKVTDQPVAGKDVDKATDAIEGVTDQALLDLKTARGDIRDVLLDIYKHRPKVWTAMSQLEQQQLATTLDQAAEALVRKVARVLATAGHKSVPGTLESMNIKDGLKLTVKAPMTMENVDALADGIGKPIMILRSMEGVAMGERGKAKVDPDQPSLIPDDDSDLASDVDGLPPRPAPDFE